MPRPRTLVITLAAVTAVALAVALPLFQPWRLFTSKVVDESLPGGSAATTGTTTVSTPPSSTAAPTVSNKQATLARGTFVSHEHDTRGSVALLRLADGSRVLRLEKLDTSDGPDLKVWLTDAPVVSGSKGWRVFDDGRYVNLGDLKGNKGNQNYVVPPDLDLAGFRSVSIWCDRFNVSFGAAELTPA
jgi:hypothetical protein